MNILDLQKFLFGHNPSRLELVDYAASAEYPAYTVFVYRNHSFELIEHTIKAYLDYAQMAVRFEYGDYDDSLSFSNLNTQADLIILWLDFSRYTTENVHDFIEQRIRYLRGIFKKNVLVAPLNGEGRVFPAVGVLTMELQTIKEKLGKKYLDERLESFSGTKLSSLALIEISKTLALKYLPALLKPAIKAVIVDLDNTLYQGVLGEDGIDGIVLTEGHRALQQFLFGLSKNGILICVVTKNNHDDVKKMFDSRDDFPLKWDAFAKVCASWDLKSHTIAEIKKYLNVNEDSMVFIDDNAGEIIEVMSVFPNIKVIHASQEAAVTYKILQNFPGIYRFNNQPEDSLRKDDIKANEKRYELQQVLSPDEYIKSLGITLAYKINNHNDISRIVELSNKTNQFIFSYKRYTNIQITECMEDKNCKVISIFLKDKLSDSGMIGACVINKTEKTALLDELFISCRALGRGIEEIMILGAVKLALDRLNTGLLRVNFIKGERNTPAELFANKYLRPYLPGSAFFNYQNTKNLLEVCIEG
ncbi:MAG: HAD-IIIC family phosphatase [Treponema sp.]|jgi:FkbH-like protein|nr:HAD-IIIC family phosphatase [Treponema sp.]